jgi:hypothetical protein
MLMTVEGVPMVLSVLALRLPIAIVVFMATSNIVGNSDGNHNRTQTRRPFNPLSRFPTIRRDHQQKIG